MTALRSGSRDTEKIRSSTVEDERSSTRRPYRDHAVIDIQVKLGLHMDLKCLDWSTERGTARPLHC